MAKQLTKALDNGVYTASVVGISTTVEVNGAKVTIDCLNDREKLDELGITPDYYSLKVQLSDRTITVNKFANKVIWTDANGDGWTSLDFFTSGLQRQLGLEDETDDIVILASAKDINLWISQYVNPKTGARSYNVDSSKPKTWDAEEELGLEF